MDFSTKKLLVISAPSGAGKTTIAQRLLGSHPDWRFSVSATTRSMRAGEVEGKDYYFLAKEEFRRKIEENELVEWEEIFGNHYGTLKSEIRRLLESGETERVIFDVDVKGALSIRRAFPEDSVLIFIAPPSLEELRHRLESRRSEDEESILRRIDRARMEMEMRREFDVVVVNDTVDRATAEIESLFTQ